MRPVGSQTNGDRGEWRRAGQRAHMRVGLGRDRERRGRTTLRANCGAVSAGVVPRGRADTDEPKRPTEAAVVGHKTRSVERRADATDTVDRRDEVAGVDLGPRNVVGDAQRGTGRSTQDGREHERRGDCEKHDEYTNGPRDRAWGRVLSPGVEWRCVDAVWRCARGPSEVRDGATVLCHNTVAAHTSGWTTITTAHQCGWVTTQSLRIHAAGPH